MLRDYCFVECPWCRDLQRCLRGLSRFKCSEYCAPGKFERFRALWELFLVDSNSNFVVVDMISKSKIHIFCVFGVHSNMFDEELPRFEEKREDKE